MPKDPRSTSLTACTGFHPETGKPCTCIEHNPRKNSKGKDVLCRCGHKKLLHKGLPETEKTTTVDGIFNEILGEKLGLRDRLDKFRKAQDETNHGLKNKGEGSSAKEDVCQQSWPRFVVIVQYKMVTDTNFEGEAAKAH